MIFSSREFSEFNGLLAAGVERGLSLEPALELLIEQARSRRVREVLGRVRDGLREGRPLEAALGAAAGFVPDEYPAWVAAGVASRRLGAVLRQVEAYHAFQARVRERFARFGVYLLIGLVVGIAALGVLGIVGSAFAGIGEPRFRFREPTLLERTTRWIGDHPIASFGVLGGSLALGLGVLALGLKWGSSRGFGYWIPLWGPLFRSRDLAGFCGLAAMRLRAGSTLNQALAAAAEGARNRKARREIEAARARGADGIPFSEALFYRRWFPRTLAWAVSIAESRGELPELLESFANVYAAEMDRRFEVVYLSLTPLGILALGNLAFFIVALLFVPMFNVVSGM